MKILYLSCHSVLEFDEVGLFTEMGNQVFSMGVFLSSNQGDTMRSQISSLYQDEAMKVIGLQCSKENLHPNLVGWADVVISMHNSKTPQQEVHQPWIVGNWHLFKNKPVIWRSIGQSLSHIEKELSYYKDQGLKIVRYSPRERNIDGYCGEDAMIRFYKDPEEFKDWNGDKRVVINFSQSLKVRGDHCGYQMIMDATKGFKRKIYGVGNENLGKVWGGVVSYEEQKEILRNSRVYIYHGTTPAPYTLSFIEALMTGTPVVAVGSGITNKIYGQETNEIEDIIQNGVNGFVGNSVEELRNYIQLLMDDYEVAKRISAEGRKTAISMFAKDSIRKEWDILFHEKLHLPR